MRYLQGYYNNVAKNASFAFGAVEKMGSGVVVSGLLV